MSTASQISHGAPDRSRVLGTVALMSPLALWSDGTCVALQPGGDGGGGSPSLRGCVSNSWVLPLDQTLLPRVTPSSLLDACLGCWQHQAFYPSQHLFLTVLCFKTQVSVTDTNVSISC